MISLSLGVDAVEWLRGLPDASAHCVITDPAYESLEKHRKVGTTTRLTGEWFEIFPNARYPELFTELYRVLTKNAHCYVMCDAETMFIIKEIGEAAGFKFWKPIVWDKLNLGMGYHYRARCEFILFFEKGKRKLKDLSIPDVLRIKSLRGKDFYPTEKPVELFETLILQSTNEFEVVLDSFMGSGNVGVASLKNNRLFMGNDLSPEAGGNINLI